ncbi:MAG TPA: hypothetical protein VG963_31605, partial [Polyangiaceae bacterium]|nr:hypothetical protein [Polyangiaceae bacterium]
MSAPDLERAGAASEGADQPEGIGGSVSSGMAFAGLGVAGVGETGEEALAEGAAPCDLLYAVPFRRIDVEGGVRALTFAFSSGDVGDVFVRLLDKSELAPSPFAARDFADDIFLREFVARCLTIRVAGHERMSAGVLLQRLVAAPPGDIAHTRFRQEILRELVANPATRKQLEKLHGFLGQFRDLASRRGVTASSSTELRLALLHSLRRIIELLSTGFATCRS